MLAEAQPRSRFAWMQGLKRWSSRVSIRPEDVCGKYTSRRYRTLLKAPADAKQMPRMSEVHFKNPPRNVGRGFGNNRDGHSHAQNVRSNVRYWIASAMCLVSILSAPSRSATVRATLRMRS